MSNSQQDLVYRNLELLGLTSQEIQILTLLLSEPKSFSTLDLEKLTELPKHQIYRALKRLIHDNYIEELSNTIPKKYFTSHSTIEKNILFFEEKSYQEKKSLSLSNQDDLYNLFMDQEQKQAYILLLKEAMSRNELCETLQFSYEKVRNITQKLETKKHITSYKKGKIILYRSNSIEEIINQRIGVIEKALEEKKKFINNILNFTSEFKETDKKALSETKIDDYQIVSKVLNKLNIQETIYSSLFIAVDFSEFWSNILFEELSTAIKLANKGYKIHWVVSNDFISLLNNLDIDNIRSIIELHPNFSIKIYNKLIERIIIFNSSEFYHFSFSSSFLETAIYHNDPQITSLKIQEFNQAWENSYDIRPLIIESLENQDLIDFINPDQQIESILTYNIALMGDKGVGKTSLVERFLTGKFTTNLRVTLGIKVDDLLVKLPDRLHQPASDVRLLVYDFCGQETFHSSYGSQMNGKHAFGLVFALNDKKSFENLDYWMKFITNQNREDPFFILIGTKKDLEDRSIDQNDIWDFRKKYRLENYFEISAVDGTNVLKLFETIAELFNQLIKKNEEIKKE